MKQKANFKENTNVSSGEWRRKIKWPKDKQVKNYTKKLVSNSRGIWLNLSSSYLCVQASSLLVLEGTVHTIFNTHTTLCLWIDCYDHWIFNSVTHSECLSHIYKCFIFQKVIFNLDLSCISVSLQLKEHQELKVDKVPHLDWESEQLIPVETHLSSSDIGVGFPVSVLEKHRNELQGITESHPRIKCQHFTLTSLSLCALYCIIMFLCFSSTYFGGNTYQNMFISVTLTTGASDWSPATAHCPLWSTNPRKKLHVHPWL